MKCLKYIHENPLLLKIVPRSWKHSKFQCHEQIDIYEDEYYEIYYKYDLYKN